MPAQFGMIGLGTMGLNLVLNMADKGIAVCGYDRNPEQQKKLVEEGAGKPVLAVATMQEFVNALEKPRRIMMLVPAGKIVDAVIAEVTPLLQAGDILIDGGNSHFTDTDARVERLRSTGIHFTGMGISGGEDGARKGPSMMPGGDPGGYAELQNILVKIAAQTSDGPCVAFIGNGSAGHYTKMVHNGIEYALMQLISEVYGILKTCGGLTNGELHQVFTDWNKTELQSFLIEITAAIFAKKDEENGLPLVDLILDKARQKGTGKWTSQNAMDLNVPVPTIDVAVSMRYLSAMKEERVNAAAQYTRQENAPGSSGVAMEKEQIISLCKNALHFGFLLSYAQGLQLLQVASANYNYGINIAEVIRIWKGGCIIRSVLLNDLRKAYQQDEALSNIILSPIFQPVLKALRGDTTSIITTASGAAIPVAALAASLQYFDAYGAAQLPANLIQAQRDYFGAHTYERIDKPGDFHAEWIDKPLVVTSEQKPKKE
ncbi:MAG: NADP-dependent phosphogluconate dehydrogenase [Ferruginibacter sp.]|nr:NADP-dependent phosphogluconate dehydrogenase [Chitinophagaceae bacterium]